MLHFEVFPRFQSNALRKQVEKPEYNSPTLKRFLTNYLWRIRGVPSHLRPKIFKSFLIRYIFAITFNTAILNAKQAICSRGFKITIASI